MFKERKLYNADTFYKPFFEDLQRAQALVIIHSPYLSTRQINRFKGHFQDCGRRGVRICVIAQQPTDWNRRDKVVSNVCSQLESAMIMFKRLDVHVTLRPLVHQKLVVVDDEILWTGSMNVLSHFETKERMERWKNRYMVEEAIVNDDLGVCDDCESIQALPLVPTENFSYSDYRQILGRYIANSRQQMHLTQSKLATQTTIKQPIISGMEQGTKTVRTDTLYRLEQTLGFQLLPIPWHYVRSVTELVNQICQKRPSMIAQPALKGDFSYVNSLLEFGKQMSWRRQYLSVTKSQLAEQASIKTAMVSEVEDGKRTVQLDTLYRIAVGLKCQLLPIPLGCVSSVRAFLGDEVDLSTENLPEYCPAFR
jgi:transcriptional regulator with XRE-family HTH domain